MASVVHGEMDGPQADIVQAELLEDQEIDRTFSRLCVILRAKNVPVPKIAARLRVHRATVYRWIAQMPESEREYWSSLC